MHFHPVNIDVFRDLSKHLDQLTGKERQVQNIWSLLPFWVVKAQTNVDLLEAFHATEMTQGDTVVCRIAHVNNRDGNLKSLNPGECSGLQNLQEG